MEDNIGHEPDRFDPLSSNARNVVVGPLPARIVPALVANAGDRASLSFVNFFTAEIENANTRTACLRSWCEFSQWAEGVGLPLEQVQPFHVAAYREVLTRRYHAHSVKQHLSALCRLFDKLVVDQ